MSNFLQDIIINILSRLPAKSLGRFKCVCKPWLHLISDPNFVKMHFLRETQTNNFNLILCTLNEDNLYSVHNQTSFSKAVEIKHPGKTQYNSIQVLGSCNGLLYIESVHYEAIWNPCTKEFKKIPESPETHYSEQTFHGFGYDPTIDDYKAVKVVQPSKKSKGYTGSEVMVFTMGTNSWRKIENINYHLHCDPALCVSEYIVWLAKAGGKYGGPDSFVFFHLVDEKFRKVSLPSECVNHMVCATVLDGHLCILNDGEKVQGDVWVMKEDGGKESWSKLFTIAAEERHEPEPVRFKVISSFSWLKVLCLTKTGDVLLAYDDGDLLLYVPKLDTIEILPMLITPRQFTATPYVESLVSLKSGTYVGRKQTKRKRGPSTISRW